MEYEKIKTLLTEKVKSVIEENEKQRKIKEEQGDFFNIFSILNVERNEVYTHSAMLCELLNPKGSHGKGDTFLQLFIEEMPLRNIEDKKTLKTQRATVKKEEPIGNIDRKKETGGQIDVLIEFKNPEYAIVIENKIDARDQNAQLARYYNYAKEKYGEKFTLFYLTKYGYEPSEISIGKTVKEEHYWKCISYTKDIKTWLKNCIEKCSDSLMVRGTIKQYSNLIDKITDQELDMTNNKELIKKIYTDDLCEIASEFNKIWQEKDSLVAEIIADKIAKQNEDWKPLDDYYEKTTIFNEIGNNMFLFFEPKNCQIGFYCDKGLKTKEPQLKKILDNLEFKFLSKNESQSSAENGKDIWCYISFGYDGENSIDSTEKRKATTKETIEKDYYNEIDQALKTLKNRYKEKFPD